MKNDYPNLITYFTLNLSHKYHTALMDKYGYCIEMIAKKKLKKYYSLVKKSLTQNIKPVRL